MIAPIHTHLLAGKKVLVIDDSVAEQFIIARSLVATGAVLYPAYNGTDGINVAKAITPDLIILDKVLPDLSPLYILDKIKREVPGKPSVIIYTANTRNEDWPVLQAAGAIKLLIKYLPAEELIKTLSTHLPAAISCA